MSRLILIIAALIACTAPHAHETWLMPDSFSTSPGQVVRFDLTSGMGFPQLDNAIQPPRVENALYRLNGKIHTIGSLVVEEKSLALQQVFVEPGMATVWIDLFPREIELDDDSVMEYLDEINAGEAIRSLWQERRGKLAWKERYAKHAKTHISVGGAGSNDASWKESIGTALELVISNDPHSILPGNQIEVRLLANSEPVPDLSVGLLIDDGGDRIFQVTDPDGYARFTAPRAGRAMFFAVQLHPTEDPERWDSDFATLTFEISASR